MSDNQKIRSILVALDASKGSLAAVDAAALLASLLQARVDGLFVEDERILRVSQSPLGRQVDFLTSSTGTIDTRSIERQLRAQARRARGAFERAVKPYSLAHSFRVRRGCLVDEVMTAADEADLVSLGAKGWSLRDRRKLGTMAQAILDRSGRLLVVRNPLRLDHAIAVLHEAGPAGADTLELGLRIAQAGHIPIRILALGRPDDAARQRIIDQVQGRGVETEIQWLGATDPEILALRIGRQTSLLLIPFIKDPAAERRLNLLQERLECAFLVVAQEDESS